MAESTPYISVIIPVYNCGQFLPHAIESVISQTYTNIEVIIINDCSQDDSEEVILNYAKADKRIIYLKNRENRGVAYTRNKGVSLARGEWIAFLDSDDLWHPDKLTKQINLSEKKKAKMVFTGTAFMNSSGQLSDYVFHVPTQTTYKELLKQNVISCSSVFIKKELIAKHKMICDHLHEDYITWLKILKTGVTAYGIDEPLLIYRISQNSKSANKWKSAKATFQVYRYMGLNFFTSARCFAAYTFRSLKKYKNI